MGPSGRKSLKADHQDLKTPGQWDGNAAQRIVEVPGEDLFLSGLELVSQRI